MDANAIRSALTWPAYTSRITRPAFRPRCPRPTSFPRQTWTIVAGAIAMGLGGYFAAYGLAGGSLHAVVNALNRTASAGYSSCCTLS